MKQTLRGVLLSLVVVASSVGCGGSSLPAPDSGVGGAGGAGAQAAEAPGCLRNLVAACTCQSSGTCGARTCFATGVTSTTTEPDGGPCNNSEEAETKVFKPDGSLCFSVRLRYHPDMGCEAVTISWVDAAGQVVASAFGYQDQLGCELRTPLITCAATGETGTVPALWPASDCPANACP